MNDFYSVWYEKPDNVDIDQLLSNTSPLHNYFVILHYREIMTKPQLELAIDRVCDSPLQALTALGYWYDVLDRKLVNKLLHR